MLKGGWLGQNDLDWYSAPDGLGEQIYALVSELNARGYEAFFAGDGRDANDIALEIDLDRQISHSSSSKKILVYTEPDFVQPQNIYFPSGKYDIVFSLRSDQPESATHRRYNYPRSLTNTVTPGFVERDILVSCIAANKNAVVRSSYNLYPRRKFYISHFNKLLGHEFHLYGAGWNRIDHPIGLTAKMLFRSTSGSRFLKRRAPLVSYRGVCDSKSDIMQRSRFTLCVENTSAPGAMTEKIVDCFQYGSVPLYLGSPDIADLISKDLFIDLKSFSRVEYLVTFMKRYTEHDYQVWKDSLSREIERIANQRSVKRYVDNIVKAVKDLIGDA